MGLNIDRCIIWKIHLTVSGLISNTKSELQLSDIVGLFCSQLITKSENFRIQSSKNPRINTLITNLYDTKANFKLSASLKLLPVFSRRWLYSFTD